MIQDSEHHELNAVHATQELYVNDHTARIIASEVPATEMAQELQDGISPAKDTSREVNAHENIPLQQIAIVPSAHTQAQRHREMEWLAQEEARMRGQRQRLMRQV